MNISYTPKGELRFNQNTKRLGRYESRTRAKVKRPLGVAVAREISTREISENEQKHHPKMFPINVQDGVGHQD